MARLMGKLGAAVAIVMAAMLIAPTASAQDTHAAVAAARDSQVSGLIAANPGATRVADNKVVLANGVVAILRLPGEVSTAKAATSTNALANERYEGCSYYYLCIRNEAGGQWDFYNCGFVNIGLNGWSDQLREVVNNQTRGTVSVFFNWDGSEWDQVGTIRARHYTGYIAPPSLLRTTDGIIVC